MAHTYTRLLNHIVFSTKERVPFINHEWKSELYAYMGGIIKNLGGKPLKINGPEDHVHVLTDMAAAVSVAELVGKLKCNSTKWVHERWPRRWTFAWQQGYFAESVSQSELGWLIEYIERQEEHHRRVSFRDEFRRLLEKNRIVFDERYFD